MKDSTGHVIAGLLSFILALQVYEQGWEILAWVPFCIFGVMCMVAAVLLENNGK